MGSKAKPLELKVVRAWVSGGWGRDQILVNQLVEVYRHNWERVYTFPDLLVLVKNEQEVCDE